MGTILDKAKEMADQKKKVFSLRLSPKEADILKRAVAKAGVTRIAMFRQFLRQLEKEL